MKKHFIRNLVCALSVCLLATVATPMTAQAAKRNANTNLTYVGQVFDADYYFNQYPDVAAAFGHDNALLLNHYVNFGMREGRNASATFNATTYRNNYADLKRAFGRDLSAFCRHYVEYGMAEGRNAIDQLVAPTDESGTVIATYTTTFDAKIGRATNVKLAASQINGRVLQPGEQFSYLASLTPRTLENGYVVAAVFSGGKVSKGIGGGICQVSSTLYAALLGTSVQIDERHAHSLPVSYVPKGMDATVSSPSLDFRFTNTYQQPLLISAYAGDDGVLTIDIKLQ